MIAAARRANVGAAIELRAQGRREAYARAASAPEAVSTCSCARDVERLVAAVFDLSSRLAQVSR